VARDVLVTGGAGFIGSKLAASLLADGYGVVIADDLSTGKRKNVPAGAEFVQLDLSRADEVASLPRREYAGVLHLAGQSSGERSFRDPARDFDANARSTLLLAGWALEHGVPALLHASSMGVYGDAGPAPVAEDAPALPVSYYGASKLAAERILAVAATQGLRTCALRMFNVYGSGQDLANLEQGMVSIYLAFVLRGEPVVVKGALDRVRDLVHVDDVVAAWKLALEQPVSGALNVGTGVGTRVDELLERLFAACGVPGHRVLAAEPTPGDIHSSVADIERIRDALGWEPRMTLADGLQELTAGIAVRSPA
jgi:UDP-glucose 4-epimerase